MENQANISNKSLKDSKVIRTIASIVMLVYSFLFASQMITDTLPYVKFSLPGLSLSALLLRVFIIIVFIVGGFSVFALSYGIYKNRRWAIAPMFIFVAVSLYHICINLLNLAFDLDRFFDVAIILIFVYLYKNRKDSIKKKYSSLIATFLIIIQLFYIFCSPLLTLLATNGRVM